MTRRQRRRRHERRVAHMKVTAAREGLSSYVYTQLKAQQSRVREADKTMSQLSDRRVLFGRKQKVTGGD